MTWPGKETDPPEPVSKGWRITIRTRMPAPCDKKLFASGTDLAGETAGRLARTYLNQMVKRHINGCKKCKDNNVQKP